MALVACWLCSTQNNVHLKVGVSLSSKLQVYLCVYTHIYIHRHTVLYIHVIVLSACFLYLFKLAYKNRKTRNGNPFLQLCILVYTVHCDTREKWSGTMSSIQYLWYTYFVMDSFVVHHHMICWQCRWGYIHTDISEVSWSENNASWLSRSTIQIYSNNVIQYEAVENLSKPLSLASLVLSNWVIWKEFIDVQ